MSSSTKKIALCGLLIAMSFVGANIKIFGTIAFDSMPAFLGTLVLGFSGGAAIGFLGHILTALTSGFPFGPVIHFIIAVSMIFTMWIFKATNTFLESRGINWIICIATSCLLAGIVNGPVTLLCLVPMLGKAVCLSLVVPLFTVSIANSVLGHSVYQALVKTKIVTKRGVLNESM